MKGRGRRLKGANGEREFFAICNDAVADLDLDRDKEGRVFFRHPSPRAGKGQQDNHDPFGKLPVAIEVKRQERTTLPKWIDQAKEQARPDQLPVLAYRQNGEPWSVLLIMNEEQWSKILRLLVHKDRTATLEENNRVLLAEVKRLREAIAEQCCFDPMLCGRDGYICLACELSGEEDE